MVVDFAGLRDAYAELGGKAEQIEPLCPVDLVVDHSIQVDFAKTLVSSTLFFCLLLKAIRLATKTYTHCMPIASLPLESSYH